MRTRLMVGAAGAALILLGATASVAAPTLLVTHAVARVTIVPEDRSDIAVTVMRTNPKFPLNISRAGDQVTVDGGLGWRGANCETFFGHLQVGVFGVGSVSYDDMPQIVVHTPRQVVVHAGGAVFGTVGRGDGVELANSGCGDWTLANQSGPLTAYLSGSGDLRAGEVSAADLHISGSSDVYLKSAQGGLAAAVSGSGDVDADQVDGPLRTHVTGSGDVKVKGGAVTQMQVAVAGSGDVRFGGVAQSLDASVAGSGDVSVAKVSGPVVKHIAGSGDVTVGQ
jgi:hypothetical protein